MIEKRMKELRENNNLQQKEVAQMLNITATSYNNYESGIRRPHYELLVKIAEIYSVTVDYLLGITNVRHCDIVKFLNFMSGVLYLHNIIFIELPVIIVYVVIGSIKYVNIKYQKK